MTEKNDEIKLKISKKRLFQVIAVFVAIALIFAAGSITGYFTFAERTPDGIEGKTMNFINTYFMQPGMQAQFVESNFEDGLYSITISVEGEIFDVFVSEDGRYLFLEAIDMDDFEMLQMVLGPEVEIDYNIIGKEVTSQQEAEQKVLGFVNTYLLPEEIQTEIIESSVESGLYKISLIIQGDVIDVYTNQDGNFLFIGAIDMDEEIAFEEQPIQQPIEEVELTHETKYNEEGQLIVWWFWGEGCPHCTNQKPFIEGLEIKYGDSIEVRSYDTWSDREYIPFFQEVAAMYGVEARGVPATFIGNKNWVGFADYMALEMEAEIEKCIETIC